METKTAEKIAANPKYQKLVAERSRYGWTLTIVMLIVYYGYIGMIAFDKELLAKRIGEGAMTYGIPIGMGIIVVTVILTGLYVRRANEKYDRMTQEIVEESMQ